MSRLLGRVVRLLAGIALLAVTVLIPSGAAASGLGLDCKDAPSPDTPGSGITGWLDYRPAGAAPPTGDNWVNGHPAFAHYGYAGLRWNTYDLGCGADLARNPGAVVGTEVGNFLFLIPKFAVGLTNYVVHFAFHPSFLSVFDPLVVKATTALRDALFNKWASLAVVAAALLLLWRLRRVRLSASFTMVGWAVAVFTLAAAVFSWPLLAGQTTDKVVTTVLGAVNSGINGTDGTADPADEVAQNLTTAILYQQWKTGEFGDANSTIAQKYARPMWESQTLTWADKATIAKDPDGAGKRLLEFKSKQFTDTAAKIKDEDPTTYEYIQGKRGDDRFGSAVMATFAAAMTIPFLLVSCFLILACFLVVRFAVIFFPAIATLAVNYEFRSMLKGMLNAVAAAIINSIIFGAGASITILAVGVLTSPDNKMPIVLRLLLIGLTTAIMWVVLKPFRKLTTMVSKNHNAFGHAVTAVSDQANGMKRDLMKMGKQALASYAGNAVALKRRDKRRDEEEQDEQVSEDTPVAEPDTEPEEEVVVVTERLQLSPARQPAAALGTRPEGTEDAPYERPAARRAEGVETPPVPPAMATRPAAAAVGPYEASPTGDAVAPVALPAPPEPTDESSNPSRPEYAAGAPAAPSGRRHDDVWQPGDPEPARDPESELVDLHGSATVDENGDAVWPVYSPSTGVTFDAATPEPGTQSTPTPAPAPQQPGSAPQQGSGA